MKIWDSNMKIWWFYIIWIRFFFISMSFQQNRYSIPSFRTCLQAFSKLTVNNMSVSQLLNNPLRFKTWGPEHPKADSQKTQPFPHCFPSWWLNHPSPKIWVNLGSFPQFSGWKWKKYLKPPSSFCLLNKSQTSWRRIRASVALSPCIGFWVDLGICDSTENTPCKVRWC